VLCRSVTMQPLTSDLAWRRETAGLFSHHVESGSRPMTSRDRPRMRSDFLAVDQHLASLIDVFGCTVAFAWALHRARTQGSGADPDRSPRAKVVRSLMRASFTEVPRSC